MYAIRSYYDVTCPMAVQRFIRDLKAAGLSVNKQDSGLDNLEEMLGKTREIISDEDYAIVTSLNKNKDKDGFIYLDEFECPTNGPDQSFDEWMEVISRQIFSDAVSQKMFVITSYSIHYTKLYERSWQIKIQELK